MPELAARFADECNVAFETFARAEAVFRALDAACEKEGRDPATLARSVALTVVCAEEPVTLRRRAVAAGRDLAELRRDGLAGRPEEVAEALSDYAAIGVSRVYLQILDLADLDHVRLLGEQLLPLVG